MRPGLMHEWFERLPPWMRNDRSSSEGTESFTRRTSMASTGVSKSVGASTRRRSRAHALRCLEGRKSSSATTSTDFSQYQRPRCEEDAEDDSEDEDPWCDPWKQRSPKRWGGHWSQHTSSSTYSNDSSLRQLQSIDGDLGHAGHIDYDGCHLKDHVSPTESESARESETKLKHSSFAAMIKAALRLSHHESDDDGMFRPPAVPIPARLTGKTLAFHQSRGANWTDGLPPGGISSPPHIFPAPQRSHIQRRMIGLGQAPFSDKSVGCRQPYWTPTISTPEDTYYHFSPRPLHKHEDMVFNVDLDRSPPQKVEKMRQSPEDDATGASRRTAVFHAIAMVIIAFTCFGLQHAQSIFMKAYVSRHAESSIPATSLIGSTQLALMIGLSTPISTLVPRARRGLLYCLGTALLVLSLCCSAWCTSISALWLVQGLLTGLGMTITLGVGIASISAWSNRLNPSLLLAPSTAGGYAGGIFYSLITDHLLARHGYPTTMRALAAIVLLMLLPPIFLMRARKQPLRSDMGRHYAASTTRGFALSGHLRFGLLLIGMAVALLAANFVPVYAPPLASTRASFAPTDSCHVLVILLAAGSCGGLLVSVMTYNSPTRVFIIAACATISSGIVTLVWFGTPQPSSFSTLALTSAFYGLTSSALQVFCLAVPYQLSFAGWTGQIEQTSWRPEKRLSMRQAIFISATSLAILLGAPAAGAFVTEASESPSVYDFRNAQIFAGIALVVGGVLMLLSVISSISE